MEETVRNKKNIGIIIVSILTILIVAGFLVAFFGFMSTYAQVAGATPTFSIYMSNLYIIGGFALIAMVLFILFIFVAKEKRELLSKVFIWGVLLLAAMYSTAFFSNWSQAAANVSFYASYIPWVALTVAAVAMIACWDSNDKKRLNMIQWICLAASVVMSVFYFVGMLTALMSTEALAIYNLVVTLAINAGVNMFLLLLALITRSKRTFDKVIFAMSDEEAEIVERIEARVDEIADEVEEMAAEGEAFVEAKVAAEIMEEETQKAQEQAAEEEIAIETEVVIEEDADGEEK